MQKLVEIGGRLAIICTVAALVLALVNAVTAPVIAENRQEALDAALQQIVGDAEVGDRIPVGGEESEIVRAYYPVGTSGPPATRYVVELLGSGYGGEMQLLAGIAADGEVFSAVLMQNSETPGLGKEAERPGYMEGKFIGKGDEEPIPATKSDLPPEEAEAVSGSTVTFMGIADALRAGSRFVKERL
ncbi:MAG: FMN-binding protein [Spirochaetes bacterium]|jgi:electron transport complex protein RnfG|nr:FMN-binding protein [Spirochaetota bacterium]